MKKYIHITKEDREAIMKSLGVTARMVFYAIRFDAKKGRSELARKIRKMAMNRGGIVMVVIPEIECLHDADGYIREYFPNGVLLEFSKKDGSCDVYHKGDKVEHYDNVQVANIRNIQEQAAALR